MVCISCEDQSLLKDYIFKVSALDKLWTDKLNVCSLTTGYSRDQIIILYSQQIAIPMNLWQENVHDRCFRLRRHPRGSSFQKHCCRLQISNIIYWTIVPTLQWWHYSKNVIIPLKNCNKIVKFFFQNMTWFWLSITLKLFFYAYFILMTIGELEPGQ